MPKKAAVSRSVGAKSVQETQTVLSSNSKQERSLAKLSWIFKQAILYFVLTN